MPNKSSRYYFNTLILKTAALAVHIFDKSGALHYYKKKNKKYFQCILEKYFSHGTLHKSGIYSSYYLSYGYWTNPSYFIKNYIFDENGVALRRNDVKLNMHNPFITAFFGLVCFNHYIEKNDPNSLAAFWTQIKALDTFGETAKDCHWIYFPWDNTKYNIKAPWASGILQAVGLSIYLRAWKISGDEHWKNLSVKIFNSLSIHKENGGVFAKTPEGYAWIEERPAKLFHGTLNGFIFNLVAVYEYIHLVDNSNENQEFIQKLNEGLFKSLHHYCYGKFTKYSLISWQFHNIEYQGLYAYLFQHLYLLSGKESFLNLANQYEKYTDWKLFYSFYDALGGRRNIRQIVNFIKK